MKTNFPSIARYATCFLLAVSSGSGQQIVTLKDINVSPVQSSEVTDSMVAFGSKVFLTSDDDVVGSELWSFQIAAAFNNPQSVAVDNSGNVFVADTDNHTIRKITPEGIVSVFAGSPGQAGSTNGVGMGARFSSPKGIAILQNSTTSEPNGTIYVADTGNHVIRKITPGGLVITLTGTAGQSGSANGTRDVARFLSPEGIAVTSAGVVYVADTGNHTIRQISTIGTVNGYAGSAGLVGNTNANGTNARFSSPRSLVIDSTNTLYIADTGNHTIRKIDNLQAVTTFAGSPGLTGNTDGTGAAARFSSPRGVIRDGTGTLIVADSGNHTLRRITSAGAVTTVIGSAGQSGSVNASGSSARLNTPTGVALSNSGDLFITDSGNHLIRKSTSSFSVTRYAGRDGNNGSWDGSSTSTNTSFLVQLVKDINPGLPDSEPRDLTPGGNQLFFTAIDSTGQRDLWKSDGTGNNTVRVGRNADYSSNFYPENMIYVNNLLYFVGATFNNGRELWKSNGSTAETVEVLNINTILGESSLIRDFFNFNNKLIFVANDAGTRTSPPAGAEIWTSNGTAAGTVLLSDVLPGSDSSTRSDALPYFTKFNNLLYFAAEGLVSSEPTGRELYRTTGLPNEHVLVKDINVGAGGSSPSDLVVSGADFRPDLPGVLYFVAGTEAEGRELWKSDGTTDTAGTVLVRNIRPGSDSSEITNLTPIIRNAGSGLDLSPSFGVVFSADNGTSGKELWFSNGTTDGTAMIKEITSGENGTIFGQFISISPGVVLFTVENAVSGKLALWRTDGTDAGTLMIEDFETETDTSKQSNEAKFFRSPTLIGSNLYFFLGDDEVWVTNGINDAGTELIHRFRSGTQASNPNLFTLVQGNKAVFAAKSTNEGIEPWITDGTPDGTQLISDIVLGPGHSNPSSFTAAGTQRFYFTAETGASGRELYLTDSGGGASMVKDINTSGSSLASNLFWHSSSNTLFFAAQAGINNVELWKSNGTSAGTVLLKDLNSGSLGNPESVGSNPAGFAAIGSTVYFAATSFTTGRELYKTDGTSANTKLVFDISASGQNSSDPDELVVMPATGSSRKLYFVATGSGGLNNSQATGRELWKTDGTERGTVVVKDINPGPASSISGRAYVTVVGSVVYFVAEDEKNGRELWRTSGSASSTRMVKNINNTSIGFGANNGSDPTDLINVNGKLFFLADDGVNGRELWVSNGTSSGTVRVSNLVAGSGDGGITNLTTVGDVLCFSADNGISGREVWFSDGTLAGTKLLIDYAPGSGSSNPQNLFNYQGNLLFSASDNSFGAEPRFVFMRPSIQVEQPVGTTLESTVSEIDFTPEGNLTFGSSRTLSFKVSNVGINNLKSISTQLSGLHAADFSVSTKLATTIKGAKSSTLSLKFTPREGGIRRATLTIRSSDPSTPAFVILLKGGCSKDPTVTTQPLHQLVNVGDPVTLISGISGTLPATVQWRKNGKAVAGATANPLYLWSAKTTDAGSYTAQFKNSASPGGTGTSDVAELGVVQNFSPARALNVKLNGSVKISLTSAGNGLTYLWKRSSGIPLSEDARFKGITSKTLTFTSAQTADAMEYFCEVTSQAGTVIGATTKLNVFKSPPVLASNQEIAVGIVGSVFRHVIKTSANAEEAATTFGSSKLPSGLKLDTKTGIISGIPTKAGNYPVNFTASNGFSPAPAPVPVTIVIVSMPEGLEGTYSGLVSRELETNSYAGGRSDITVTKSGSYSGSVVLAGVKYSLKGNLRFNVDHSDPPAAIPPYSAEVVIARKGISAPLTLVFEIDPTGKNRLVNAGLSSVNISGTKTASVSGWKVTPTPARYAGRYHMGIRIPEGDANLSLPNSNNVPQGLGYATFTVGSKGTLTIAGRTADGEKITCATFVGPEGEVLLYQSLYSTVRKGSIKGQLGIQTGAELELASDNSIQSTEDTFDWTRPLNPSALSTKTVTRTYKSGFGLEAPIEQPVALEAFGGFYTLPAVLLNITNPSNTTDNASLSFTDAGISAARLVPDLPNLAITSTSVITRLAAATANTSLKASRTTGAISGSFTLYDDDSLTAAVKDTEIKRVVPFQGLIVPEGGVHKGIGYFMLPQIPPAATATKTGQILSGKVSFLAD